MTDTPKEILVRRVLESLFNMVEIPREQMDILIGDALYNVYVRGRSEDLYDHVNESGGSWQEDQLDLEEQLDL